MRRLIILLGLMGMVLWAFWPHYYLEVLTPGRQNVPLLFPVSSGDRFSIWFLHSYDRAFFQENYAIDVHHQIILKDMTFKSHLGGGGFAYPHFHLRSDGVGELRGINEKREQVEFMMGSKDLANHTLLWQEKRIELADHFEAGEIISIRVAERTGWQRLFQFLNKQGERRPRS